MAFSLFEHLTGTNRLIANLIYGAGLRLNEALRLRVKDLDFRLRQINVRDGKGGKDCLMVFPTKLIEPLKEKLREAQTLQQWYLKNDLGRLELSKPSSV